MVVGRGVLVGANTHRLAKKCRETYTPCVGTVYLGLLTGVLASDSNHLGALV
ncbi:hypothetical protein ABNF97_10400 [Plantactinospora sp. B6F1]|uniref:hypothetical protein n=1 Tax=Plantactinospora sp. B6F1 TaxID=3158971 RepID=UPI0010E59F72